MERKSVRKLHRVLLIAALVVLMAAMALVMGACKNQKTEPANAGVELYWNVEGKEYRTGSMPRMADENGNVHIIFTKDGEQMRLPVKDYYLACKIDLLDVMGLVFDENGVVVDAIRAEDMFGGYLVKNYIVESVEGNKITCNASGLLDGHKVTFEITDDTPVWNIGGTGITVGIPWTVGEDDQITVIKNEDGSVRCVYTEAYTPPQDIYWNVKRMYDSASKISTRMSDPTGGYTITMACNGEVKDYKVKDSSLVQQIDGMAAKCFGLEFDEEGVIIGVTHAGNAAGGGSCASWYHCTDLDGNTATFTRLASGSNMGATYTGPLSKHCQVFDVSGNGEFIGEPTELRVGDQVHCLRDSRSRLCTIFVVSRKVESEMYWNVERKYNSKTGMTTRVPEADGWYYVTVAVRGKQITVKTQEWDIVNSIDGRAAKCFGLKLDENNVIKKFYTPNAVVGGGTFASWYNVTELNGNQITVYKSSTGDTKVGTLAPDCEIYNVSTNATLVGEVSDLRTGDLVHTLKDGNGQVCVCYIITRPVDWPVYYNLDRMYNSNSKQTTRTPDADGNYVFRMAVNGQEVTLKTKSKDIANSIDKEAAKCLTMSVGKDGTIYKAMHAKNTTICSGAASSSWTTVMKMTNNGFVTYKSETKAYETEVFAWNAKVYNVSSNNLDHQGEETTLQVGDFVHCLTNRRGEITMVYVMTRPLDLPVYYNLDRKWDDTNKVSTRTPNADGEYEFQLAYGGGEVTLKTTDPQVVYDIDKEVAMCVALRIDDSGYITYATHAKNAVYCGGGIGMSYATVTEVEGNQVTVRKDGKLTTFEISDDCEMFVTQNVEGLSRGNYTTVRVGDYIHCLKNKDGKTNYMAIMSRVKQLPKVDHTCQHVTEDVTWYAWDGAAFPVAGHYVLTEDLTMDSRVTIDAGVEITLCLNGHTVTNSDRFFNLYGTLNICDHKDASGKYKGTLNSSYSGKVYGSLAYIYNNKSDSTLNIYGGNFVHSGEANTGGIVFLGQTNTSGYVATMNLYDGVLSGGSVTAKGGAVAVTNGSIFNMYGGQISGNTSDSNGAAVNLAQGEFNMSGGVITGNTATGNGGAVDADNGVFNMTGGILENNKAAEGGNVRSGQKGEVNISGAAIVRDGVATGGAGGNFTVIGKLNLFDGATVSGGTVKTAGTAISAFANAASAHAIVTIKGVTIDGTVRTDTGSGPVELFITDSTVNGQVKVGVKNCTLTVGGKVNLPEVRLLDGKVIAIHEDGLDDASVIAVTMENNAKAFATITDANDEKCFVPFDSTVYKVVNVDNELFLESKVKPHIHCACDGTAVGKGSHTCADVTYQPWANATSLPSSGNYYLATDVNITGTVTVASGTTLNLCLNGHTVTGSIRVFSNKGNLNLSDCADAAGIIKGNQGGTQANGGVFYNYNNATFNMFGGTMTAKKVTGEGGVGCVAGGTNGIMNIYGGTIKDGQATKNGGNIVMWDGGKLNIYGGTIQNGTSTGGGNIGCTVGTLTISGGNVIGGTSSGYGGNIRVGQQSTLIVTGGQILGGTAKSGGATIYGNKSGTTVPTIQLLGGKITAGTLTSGTAGQECVLSFGAVTVGGNVQIENIYIGSLVLLQSSSKPLTIDASIGVTMDTAGVFMENVTTDLTACFVSKMSGYNPVYDSVMETMELA